MSENYIVINGKKAELTEEQLEKLGISAEIQKENPFKRVINHTYNFIDQFGNVGQGTEINHTIDDMNYNVANYCTDENLMKQRALHETLSRLLWRFACKNGELENEWDQRNEHWFISYSFLQEKFIANYNWIEKSGSEVYFSTRKIAEKAIEEIIKPFILEHPEFVW